MPFGRLFGGPSVASPLAEVLERSQRNRADLSAAVNSAITASIANQPANTARSYAKAQKLWQEFCAERQFDSGVLVSEEKLVLWLQDVVLQLRIPDKPTRKRKTDAMSPAVLRRKRRKGGGGEGPAEGQEVRQLAKGLEMPLGELLEELPAMLADDQAAEAQKECMEVGEDEEGVDRLLKAGTVDSYIAAVLQLYKVQQALGHNTNPHPRGGVLRDLVRQTKESQDSRDREAFVDRGAGGINAGYSDEEFISLQRHLIESACEDAQTYPHFLRTRLDVLMGHFYVLRGENRREGELADLALLSYPPTEGPTPCRAVIFTMSRVKTNKSGKKQFMGSLRHKNPLLCSQGAMAQYFFARWSLGGESPPNFKSRKSWYRTKLLVARAGKEEVQLSYPAQYEAVWRAFAAAGIHSVKKTHAMRGCGIRSGELHGVDEDQLRRAGRWASETMVDAYLSHLPKKFLRRVAGFTSDEGGYFLPRAQAPPPADLLQKIWPWVEEWEERFRKRSARKTWEDGGLDEDDVAAQGFLAVLRHLRVVLLQDLAVLQPDYPNLPFFRHEVFNMQSWVQYSEVVRAAVLNPEYSRSLLLEQVIPEVSHAVYNSRDSLHHQAQHLHAALNVQISALMKQMNNVAAIAASFSSLTSGGQLPLTIQFGQPPSGSSAATEKRGASQQEAQHITRPDVTAALAAFAGGQDGGEAASQPGLNFPERPSTAEVCYFGASVPNSKPPAFRLLPLHTIGDLWRTWTEGVKGQLAVEALEKDWGKDWRREGTVQRWFSARRPLIEKVYAHVSLGCTVQAAVELVETERGSRLLDKFYKDYVGEKNGGVVCT